MRAVEPLILQVSGDQLDEIQGTTLAVADFVELVAECLDSGDIALDGDSFAASLTSGDSLQSLSHMLTKSQPGLDDHWLAGQVLFQVTHLCWVTSRET